MGIWIMANFPTGPSRGVSMVDFFEVKEVTWIKQADLLDDVPPDQVVAAWHPIAVTSYRGIPVWVVHELRSGKPMA